MAKRVAGTTGWATSAEAAAPTPPTPTTCAAAAAIPTATADPTPRRPGEQAPRGRTQRLRPRSDLVAPGSRSLVTPPSSPSSCPNPHRLAQRPVEGSRAQPPRGRSAATGRGPSAPRGTPLGLWPGSVTAGPPGEGNVHLVNGIFELLPDALEVIRHDDQIVRPAIEPLCSPFSHHLALEPKLQEKTIPSSMGLPALARDLRDRGTENTTKAPRCPDRYRLSSTSGTSGEAAVGPPTSPEAPAAASDGGAFLLDTGSL